MDAEQDARARADGRRCQPTVEGGARAVEVEEVKISRSQQLAQAQQFAPGEATSDVQRHELDLGKVGRRDVAAVERHGDGGTEAVAGQTQGEIAHVGRAAAVGGGDDVESVDLFHRFASINWAR